MPENAGIAPTDDDFDEEKPKETTAPVEPEKKFSQADLDRIIEDRVSRERKKYADYGDLKKKATAALSDHERAVAEAEQRGRSEALQATGVRLARAEFRAAAAGKVDADQLDGFLEYADLRRFIDADGEPDSKAISSAIKKISGNTGTVKNGSFDAGVRTPADKPTDMNSLIRRQAGYA
jgi:hypothetical protein